MCDKFGFYSSGQSRVGETREIPKIADFRFVENAIRRIHPGFRVALRDFHTRTIRPDERPASAGIQASSRRGRPFAFAPTDST